MALLPVDDALAQILGEAAPRGAETVEIGAAGGRVLADPVTARLTQPPFDCSAMDGYALIAPPAPAYPLTLRVVGESAAGKRFDGALRPCEAVRIFTGAPLPPAADMIVIQENTRRDGDRLIILEGLVPGRHIRRAGLDFRAGEEVLPAGRLLDAPALSLAAASGHAAVEVVVRPRVAILATGDELVAPGATPGPDQIVASNSVGVAEIVRGAGGLPLDLGIIPDAPEKIEAAIAGAIDRGADILVTIGGASVGDRDYVHGALRRCGVAMDFWKIAMRPGKPLMHGRKKHGDRTVQVLGLPGNPVSSLVCSLVFLRPLVARMAGRDPAADIRAARLGAALPENDHRRDYIRAALSTDSDGALVATPLPVQDSSMLSALTRADALLIRPENAGPAAAGSPCRVFML